MRSAHSGWASFPIRVRRMAWPMTHDLVEVLGAAAKLSAEWKQQRLERQGRRALDAADFGALEAIGFLRSVVPVDHGGLWEDLPRSARLTAEILRVLARGDASVALVSAMHPAVVGLWLLHDAPDDAWQQQREAVFATALAGHQWGTITSEPGSGGDISQTRAVAIPAEGLAASVAGRPYLITGDKHFGSGTGISSYMVTTGLSDDSGEPAMFILDMRERPWEQGDQMSLLAEWDGMGMASTQSHALRLEGMPAFKLATEDPLAVIAQPTAAFATCLFTAVVIGVLDEAIGVARAHITDRAPKLRAFEQTEWARAEMDHWLAVQAYEGALRSVETAPDSVAAYASLRAKQSVARLAEDIMLRLTRVLGGGTFSQRSPFSHWFEDVRALGFLRPPWGLASDALFATSLEER